MGKVKNKSHSELEHLRGLVKELKKENGQLRRQLKEAGKYQHQYEDVLENSLLDEVKDEVIPKVADCPKCFDGSLSLTIELNDKDIFSCSSCDFRKVVKK